ncbi:hypothetical protein M1105_20100 [Limibaculum sp. FT325]|uniref:hypothetical protein n=1 Tax=Thermohalobaculum sediminis TaxID=2939436 RepID=UPI0020BE1E62|nr:hypothetical protein [Limibaculum sediminis]MCL5779264.1 hypothetical protein [Limibaculum sediminis]
MHGRAVSSFGPTVFVPLLGASSWWMWRYGDEKPGLPVGRLQWMGATIMLAVRSLVLSVCWLMFAWPAAADLVSPYGGETAPSFVELAVLEDRVHATLEIDLEDYPLFVTPDDGSETSLAERTGRTLTIAADGVPLAPVTRVVDVRERKPRVSAATAVVPPRPRSAEVVYVELEFPFAGRPDTVTFTPPLDADGMPLASLGALVEHMGVPVTDYRYLSRPETLRLDWEDPWFSAFENPVMTRHHKSPLMSFLSMEPREVRHEIIFRLRDLEQWTDLGVGDAATLTAAQMAEVEKRAAAFFADRNPVTIDGQSVQPADIRVSQIAVGVEGLRVLEDVPETDRATALLGLVLSYPRPSLADEVAMTWELFPDDATMVPVTLVDPAGGVPEQVRPDDPTVRWTNFLTVWEEPKSKPITVTAASVVTLPLASIGLLMAGLVAGWSALRTGGRWRSASIAAAGAVLIAAVAAFPVSTGIALPRGATPTPEAAHAILSGVLDNVSAAMLETRPSGYDAALASFVSEDHRNAVGSELRRGLSVSLPSGARALTDGMADLSIEEITPASDGAGTQILASWSAEVSGGHWGHLHRRKVSYRALFEVTRTQGHWFLDGLTVLSAQFETQGATS